MYILSFGPANMCQCMCVTCTNYIFVVQVQWIKMTLACSQCLLILRKLISTYHWRANEKEENDAHHFLFALRSILIGYWPPSWKMSVVTS